MRKFLIILTLTLTVLLAQEQTRYGAKYHGLGDSGLSMCLDASAIFTNPAILGLSRAPSLSIGYGLPYSGIPNAPREMYLAYHTPIRYWWGTGIGIGSFSLPNLSQTIRVNGLLGWSTEVSGTLSVGIAPSYIQISYSQPQYLEGRDSPYDPILDKTPNAFTASVGVVWKQSRYLTLALTGLDITEPNLATDPNNAGGKIPAIVAFGISSNPIAYFQPGASILFRSFTVGDQKTFEPHLGFVGQLPSKVVSWRSGWNPQQISAGISWHTDILFGGIDIDYSFVYWLPKSWAGTTSHHFGLTIWGLPQHPCEGCLSIKNFHAPETVSVGEKTEISAIIENKARKLAENFVTISALRNAEDDSQWQIIYPSKFVEKLAPKSTTTLSWNWRPQKAGKYELMVSCNDDGSVLPEMSISFCERNTKDNRASKVIYVVQQDTAEIVPKHAIVNATQVEIRVEEFPMIPVIFFGPNSTELDTFSQKLLSVIAERISSNPDVALVIRGFQDSTEKADTSLSRQRAEAVKQFLVTQQAGIANRLRIATGHNPLTPRAKTSIGLESQKISEENRRVELSAEVDVGKETQLTTKMKAILENNPELILIIKGTRSAGEDNIAGLLRAKKLEETLENNFAFLKNRIVIEDTIGDSPQVFFSIDADGILYRPIEKQPITYWTNPSPPTNTIFIHSEGLKDAAGWTLSVSFNHDRKFPIGSGYGPPPDSIEWDWKIGDKIIPPDENFLFELVVSTPRGQKEYISKVPAKLVPTSKTKLLETMILVEFVFDEVSPLSHFLERRLYNFSRDFVSRANRGIFQKVVVSGHTDSIGTVQRNLELSQKRAKKEFDIMTDYIVLFSGIDKKNLNDWLSSHNAEISFIGKGSAEPYIIGNTIIGDNSSPYGRTINRRVTLEYSHFREANQ